MNLDDYQNLPEDQSPEDVRKLLDVFLAEQERDDKDTRFRQLDVIGDKQWHTYCLPDAATASRVQDWMTSLSTWLGCDVISQANERWGAAASDDARQAIMQATKGCCRRDHPTRTRCSPRTCLH